MNNSFSCENNKPLRIILNILVVITFICVFILTVNNKTIVSYFAIPVLIITFFIIGYMDEKNCNTNVITAIVFSIISLVLVLLIEPTKTNESTERYVGIFSMGICSFILLIYFIYKKFINSY